MRALIVTLAAVSVIGIGHSNSQPAQTAPDYTRFILGVWEMTTDPTGTWHRETPSKSLNMVRLVPYEIEVRSDGPRVGDQVSLRWAEANQKCTQSHDGVSGWRLPNAAEVKSLYGNEFDYYFINEPNSASYIGNVRSLEPTQYARTFCVHEPYERSADVATTPAVPGRPSKPGPMPTLTGREP